MKFVDFVSVAKVIEIIMNLKIGLRSFSSYKFLYCIAQRSRSVALSMARPRDPISCSSMSSGRRYSYVEPDVHV